MLPLHRRHIAFNSKVDRVSTRSPGRWPIFQRLNDAPLVVTLKKVWKVCTQSNDGSLSETFKLVGSSDESDGRTSVSGLSKTAIQQSETDDLLDAVVVGDEHSLHEKSDTKGSARSDTGSQSQHTGSNANAPHQVRDTSMDDQSNYQGGLLSWLRCKAWPVLVEFFEPRLPENEVEFRSQAWHSVKLWAFFGSLYLVVNWVLYLILNLFSTEHSLYAKIVYYGGLTLWTVPTPFMVALDMPRRSPVLFQIWFCLATWWCGLTEVIQIKQCGFYTHNNCFRKDFLEMNYYITALPAMMMFIISKRIYNAIMQFITFLLLNTLIIPDQGIYARNVVSFVVFSVFIQALVYSREKAQRHMFLLAMQLRAAYRSKHKAQLAESKASFTKRRFANYIFHEVRVPLNNAVLAFQLLQSGNAFKKEYVGSTEIYALEHGLNMMKTVLNDVLDFEKMDSGHFESIPRPFPLHHSIRAIFDQIQVQTESRHLVLIQSLDARIDSIPKPGFATPEGLWVVGSELRLHQVLTNLASNAIKYTPDGGGAVRISTEFLGVNNGEEVELPGDPPEIDGDEDEGKQVAAQDPEQYEMPNLSPTGEVHPHTRPHLSSSNHSGGSEKKHYKEYLCFRLEVQDSGPGIKPSDLVDDRLFQPFVQTSVGKSSGSGTGLGLAIVKQIVKMSGGRLGVRSRRGEGAKFWIELRYPIATAEEVESVREANKLTTVSGEAFTWLEKERRSQSPVLVQREQLQPKDPSPLGPPQYEPIAATPSKPQPLPPPPLSPPPVQATQMRAQARTSSPAPSVGNANPPTAASSSSISDPLVVLVVDDDKLTRAMSSKLLTKLGCIVETASDGRECLDLILAPDARTYDLICLDNFMPEMTGEEAVRELRAQDRDDFVVGCTGNALTEDQVSYKDAGADEVLTKPIMLSDFKRVLGLAQQRRLERRIKAQAASAAGDAVS